MNVIADAPAAAGTSGGKRRRILLLIAAAFILIGLIWGALWHFVFSLRQVTDDAYVHGNLVTVAAQVPGTVTAVLADDTDRVLAGQPLVRLDPTDADLDLARARHALAQAVRQVRGQADTAAQLDAVTAALRAELAQAQSTLDRELPLLTQRAVSAQEITQLRAAVATTRAALTAAQRQAAAARAAVAGTDILRNPTVLAARDAFIAAWIAVRRDTVPAPVSGYVAQRTVQLGSRIQPGQPLMVVIPLHQLWVDANFKETQLADLRIGQPATVISDLYGGNVVFHGRVEGLSPGTGSAFALLPPQNASGNWIKVVQRVPVRIVLDRAELDRHPLRIGLSTTVTVRTTDRSGPMLAEAPPSRPVSSTNVFNYPLAQAAAEAAQVIRANLGTAPGVR